MFVKLLLLVLLPAAGYSFIQVKITPLNEESPFELSGYSVSLLSNKDRQILFPRDLKTFKDYSKIIMGQKCTDIYLSSETPWGNVYEKYGWREVQLVITPTKGKIVSISYSDPEVVESAGYQNQVYKPKVFQIKLSPDVTETANHSWSSIAPETVEAIHYELDFGHDPTWSYTSRWGQNSWHSRNTTVGNKYINISVPPKSTKIAEISAKRVTMTATVEYEVTLIGDVFCNYKNKFKNHHFYRIDISDFENTLKTLVHTFTEAIQVIFYINTSYNIVNYDGEDLTGSSIESR